MNGMHWLGLLLVVIGLLQRLLPLGPHSRRVVPGERKGAGPSRRIVYFSAESIGVGKVVSVVVSHLIIIAVVISESIVKLLDQLDQQLRVQCIRYLHQDLGLFVVVEHPAVLGLNEVVGQHAGEAVLVHLFDVLLGDVVNHVFFLDDETAVCRAQFYHFLPGLLDVGPQVCLAAQVVEDWGALPREGAAVLTEIALAVQAFIEGIEQAAIEDLVETFEELKLMLEDNSIGLVEVLRDFDHYRPFFQLPEGVEYSVGDYHHVGLVLGRLGLLDLLLARLMHVSQHFQRRRTSRYLQIAKDEGLLLAEVLHQSFEEELDLCLAGGEAFLLLVTLKLADLGLEGKRKGLEGVRGFLRQRNILQHLHQESIQHNICDCFYTWIAFFLRLALIRIRGNFSLNHFNLQFLGSTILNLDFRFGLMVQLERRMRPPQLRHILILFILLLSQEQSLLLFSSVLLIVILLLHPAQFCQLRLQLFLRVNHVEIVG